MYFLGPITAEYIGKRSMIVGATQPPVIHIHTQYVHNIHTEARIYTTLCGSRIYTLRDESKAEQNRAKQSKAQIKKNPKNSELHFSFPLFSPLPSFLARSFVRSTSRPFSTPARHYGEPLVCGQLVGGCSERTYALTQPSFSGLFVIWAHLPQTTLPLAVTMPNSLTLTSMMVPLVKTPSWVYMGDCGFFLTLRSGSWTVTASSGWVTLAFL